MDKQKNKVGSFLLDSAKGVTLGISVAIPGLSAGTIAVAERCYDTLIDSITSLRKEFKKNFFILLPYLLGLIAGALAAFVGIKRGYDVAPFTITGLFAGFILGSLPVAISELKRGNGIKEIFKHILAFSIALLIAGGLGVVTALTSFSLETALQNREIYMYFMALLAGIIGAASCIIPGISGSMSMMVIGMYFPVLNMIMRGANKDPLFDYTLFSVFRDSTPHSGDMSFFFTGILFLVILLIGAIIGLVLASKVMKKLLADHRVTTFYGIVGLILGSLISMFINSSIFPKYQEGLQTWDLILGFVLMVLSCVGIFFFIRFSNKRKEKSDTQPTQE